MSDFTMHQCAVGSRAVSMETRDCVANVRSYLSRPTHWKCVQFGMKFHIHVCPLCCCFYIQSKPTLVLSLPQHGSVILCFQSLSTLLCIDVILSFRYIYYIYVDIYIYIFICMWFQRFLWLRTESKRLPFECFQGKVTKKMEEKAMHANSSNSEINAKRWCRQYCVNSWEKPTLAHFHTNYQKKCSKKSHIVVPHVSRLTKEQ